MSAYSKEWNINDICLCAKPKDGIALLMDSVFDTKIILAFTSQYMDFFHCIIAFAAPSTQS